jgi:hypothetical protein
MRVTLASSPPLPSSACLRLLRLLMTSRPVHVCGRLVGREIRDGICVYCSEWLYGPAAEEGEEDGDDSREHEQVSVSGRRRRLGLKVELLSGRCRVRGVIV